MNPTFADNDRPQFYLKILFPWRALTLARDLIISKQSSELLASKLKEKCFLQTGSVVDLVFRLLHSNEQ